MSSPENPSNPFDRTVWDPENPEFAIEDPFHGPSATFRLLQTPPMPLGDGTYYQTGGFYAFGTVYVDARNQPVYRFGHARSTSSFIREMNDVAEWRSANSQGEEAVTALEAERQKARLEKNKVAHAFKPSDVCAGGERLEDCETASPMVEAARSYATNIIAPERRNGAGRSWTTLARLGKTCASCALHCEVAVETLDGQPTGVTRFSNTQPLPDDDSMGRIQLSPLRYTEPIQLEE